MAEELFLLDFAMLSTRCQRLALRLLKTKRNASSERMTTADRRQPSPRKPSASCKATLPTSRCCEPASYVTQLSTSLCQETKHRWLK